MPAVLSSLCPRSCPASGVQCPVRASGVPRVPVQVTGVWCGRLRVQVSSVRRPASVRPASAVSDGMRSRGVAVGPAAARLGWPGAAWSPAMSMTARRLPEVGAWRSKLAQAVLGQRRHRLGPGRRRGRWLGSGQVDRVADQDRLDARGGSPLGRGNVCSEVCLPVAGLRGTSHPRPLLLRAQETFLCGKPLTALSADSSRRSRATRRVGCSDSPDGYHAVGIKPLTSPCRPHHHRR
jgi:hypothetical protein